MRRGFTLVELMVAVAIAAIVGSVATSYVWGAVKRQRLNAAARTTLGALRSARAQAIGHGKFAIGNAQATIATAGVRIVSATRLVVFVDADDRPETATQLDVRTVDLVDLEADGSLVFSAPATGSIVRFARDGGTTATSVVIRDTASGRTRTVEITAGGQALVD